MTQKKYDGRELPKTLAEVKAHFRNWMRFGKDIKQFAIDRGLVNYMLIQPGTERAVGVCTHCGRKAKLEAEYSREERKKWEQDSKITCPECGASVHVLVRKAKRIHQCFFYWWEKSALNPEAIVCRGIHVTRIVGKEGWEDAGRWRRGRFIIDLDSAAVFIYGKGSVMARAVTRYEKGDRPGTYKEVTEMKVGSVRGRTWKFQHWGGPRMVREADGLKEAIAGTPFAWSQWERWNDEENRIFAKEYSETSSDWNIDRELLFFARFVRYPAWEWLLKMGLGRILGGYTDRRDRDAMVVLNFRGKDIDHIFRTHLTKADKLYMLKGTIGNSGVLGMLQQWRRYCPKSSLEDVDWIANHMDVYVGERNWNSDEMHQIYRLASPGKLRAYVERQEMKKQKEGERKKHAHQGRWFSRAVRMTEYTDYLDELKQLGYDMADKNNLFPADFQKAHEHAAREVVALKMKQDEGKWDRRRESCREKYDFYDKEKGMKVIVPEHLSELVKEGEAMHNCVGTYIARVARADTDVVFVRRTANPEESYITVEVEPGTGRIIQAREKNNTAVKGKPARDFMAAFAVHAARAAKKYKAMGKSPKSAEEGRKAE